MEFVAEISSNHNGNLDRCIKLIETAAKIGCDAVKFQLFKIDDLFAPEVLTKSQMHRDRRAWELPVEFLPTLAMTCHDNKVKFSCTPFYLAAVDELLPFVDAYKIASYELLWLDLIRAVAGSHKPVIVSTGMASLPEIGRTVEVLKEKCLDFTLLHCVSNYPTIHPNLGAIEMIRKTFNCPVGWSDHSVDEAIIYRAVHRWGATMVEFHLDLDTEGWEYNFGHCWTPQNAANMIATIRKGIVADGEGVKAPLPEELPEVLWRADPVDGLRPFMGIRNNYNGT